jgi:hypothetical protein
MENNNHVIETKNTAENSSGEIKRGTQFRAMVVRKKNN